MNHKRTILWIAFLLFGLEGIYAQETISPVGGKATGAGGTANYTVGQLVYTTNTGTNGSIAQGVQQPYEISTTASGVNETAINLEMRIYPNPTTIYLTLTVEDNLNLNYQLLDMYGKLIESKAVISNSTKINLKAQPSSTYLLRVTNKSELVKTFKVIKN